MLAFIVRETESFKRTHGFAPNVLYLNMKQFAALQDSAPGLFIDGAAMSLGLSLIILPEEAVLHPRVGYVRAVDDQADVTRREAALSVV